MADPFDYLGTRDDADGLIADFGQSVTVRKYTTSGPDYDPTLTATEYATQGAKVDFTWQQMRGDTVREGDQRWLIAAGPLAAVGVTDMQPPDEIVAGGVSIPVITSGPLAPGGVVVMFDCHCRK